LNTRDAVELLGRASSAGWRNWPRTWPRGPRANETTIDTLLTKAAKRFDLGHELLGWEEIGHLRINIPPKEVAAARRFLIENDPQELVGILQTVDDNGTLFVLAPYVQTEQEFEAALSLVSGSMRLASLAFSRCLRWIAAGASTGADEFDLSGNLDRLSVAAASSNREQEVSLWWQAASLGPRFHATDAARGPAIAGAIYDQAVKRIALDGGATSLPRASQIETWAGTNEALMGIAACIAERVDEPARSVLIDAFLRDATERIVEKSESRLLDLALHTSRFYMDAAARALILDRSDWCEKTKRSLATTRTGWRPSGSQAQIERSAWLVCALATATFVAKGMGSSQLAQMLSERVLAACPSSLAEWTWHMTDTRTRHVLPTRVAHAALCLPDDRRWTLLTAAVEGALHSGSVREIQDVVGDAAPPHVDSLLRTSLNNWLQYEEQLNT
jgi:hypothetical protein